MDAEKEKEEKRKSNTVGLSNRSGLFSWQGEKLPTILLGHCYKILEVKHTEYPWIIVKTFFDEPLIQTLK